MDYHAINWPTREPPMRVSTQYHALYHRRPFIASRTPIAREVTQFTTNQLGPLGLRYPTQASRPPDELTSVQ